MLGVYKFIGVVFSIVQITVLKSLTTLCCSC